MNYGPVIFLGLLFAMSMSWYGFIFKNYTEIGRQEPVQLATGARYPTGRAGVATRGQEVYQQNGCFACHTMQVRAKGYGSDIERGFGSRNTVLRDFIYDRKVFLGQVRLGPDLSNAGLRNPDENWQLVHLYNPRILVKDSMMPRYTFLFEERRIVGQPSNKALVWPSNMPRELAPPEGYEVVPTAEAEALAGYMLSLRADTPLFEAPLIPPPTNNTSEASAAGGTNDRQNASGATNDAASAPAPGTNDEQNASAPANNQ